MGRDERKDILRELERHRNSKVIAYLTSNRPNANAQMKKDILPRFVNQVRTSGKHKHLDVFIFTQGGDTITAFGLARLLREYADYIGVLVPDCCHSAGTLFALGANEIVMTRAATLSPIDPSISQPLNPAVQLNPQLPPQILPLNVESVAGYRALVTKEWHADKTSLLRILAARVHPLALGDVYRTRQQIEMLASQLLRQHRKDAFSIRRIVDTLSKNLGSHDYLIYLSEAKKLLGSQIVHDEPTEELIWKLYNDYLADMQLGVPYEPPILLAQSQPAGQPGLPQIRNVQVVLKLAVIESIEKADTALKRVNLFERQTQLPDGSIARNIFEEVVFAGWEQSA